MRHLQGLASEAKSPDLGVFWLRAADKRADFRHQCEHPRRSDSADPGHGAQNIPAARGALPRRDQGGDFSAPPDDVPVKLDRSRPGLAFQDRDVPGFGRGCAIWCDP